MGLLNKTRVYLVGHMQYINGRGWRENATTQLREMGVTVFDPYHKPFMNDTEEDETERAKLHSWMQNEEYEKVAERMRVIRNFDLRLCDISDFIIAHINPSVASWGSAEEITTSVRAKKPVFISVEGGKKAIPLWLLAMIPPKYFYNNVDEILEVLKKIDSGEKQIDNDRWKLLKQEWR